MEHIRARAEHRAGQFRNPQSYQSVKNQSEKHESKGSVKSQNMANRFRSFAGKMFGQGRIRQKI